MTITDADTWSQSICTAVTKYRSLISACFPSFIISVIQSVWRIPLSKISYPALEWNLVLIKTSLNNLCSTDLRKKNTFKLYISFTIMAIKKTVVSCKSLIMKWTKKTVIFMQQWWSLIGCTCIHINLSDSCRNTQYLPKIKTLLP